MSKITNFSEIHFDDSRGTNSIRFEDLESGVSLKQSRTIKGVFRGLHIQMPQTPQVKYISVVEGSITDYVVSLNFYDPEFGVMKSFSIDEGSGFFKIPAHCAHGFVTHIDTVFQYVCIGVYAETNEITVRHPDPEIYENIVSKKDMDGIDIEKAKALFKDTKWG